MSRRLVFPPGPVGAYADRLTALANALSPLETQLRNAMVPVANAPDVPYAGEIQADLEHAQAAFRALVDAAHDHVSTVRRYITAKNILEQKKFALAALNRLLTVRFEDDQARKSWLQEEMFNPDFMLDSTTRLSDQVELPSWRDTKAIEEFTAELGGKQAAIAFLKSMGVAASIIAIPVGIHGMLDKDDPFFQRWMAGSGAAFGTSSVLGAGVTWFAGASAPAWAGTAVEVGAAGGEIVVIAGATYVYSAHQEAEFEAAEARGESGAHIATHLVTDQLTGKKLAEDFLIAPVGGYRLVTTQINLGLFGVHEASKGIASIFYPTKTDDSPPEPPQEQVDQWRSAVHSTYPTAVVVGVSGAIRIRIPAAHGQPATIIDIDPTTGEPE